MSDPEKAVAPTVIGPVTGGRRGWPFACSIDDLSEIGYVEEEFFLEGEANAYRPTAEFGPGGHWSAEPAGSAPFRTRMLVQRPADPARFNGTVVVGWNNVTAGYELLAELPVIVEEGFAYACASAQEVGVNGIAALPQGLKTWDPERYGSLEHPGDRYSYGIFTEAALAVGPDRTAGSVDALGGLRVERVVALGASQSAARLATYINAVQPITGAFDGFLVLIHFGSGASIDEDLVFDATSERPHPIFRTRTRLRDDLDAPIMLVNSETEVPAYYESRQDDSDRFRFWEVAGASHVSAPQLGRRSAKAERDGLVGRANPNPPSNISYVPAASAALGHLQRWMTGGPPPPNQPLIDMSGDPADVSRDEHNNALGGVRMPGVEVPIGHNTGISPVQGLGGLGGGSEPFEKDKLVDLYGDHDGYVAKFSDAAAAAVNAGVLRASEADQLVKEARDSESF